MSLDRVQRSKDEHKRVMQALLDRDADEAARVLCAHITKRMDQVQDAVRHGISNIYMEGSEDISARIIEEAARMIAQGGKSIYGASVGILMLDARFPTHPRRYGKCADMAVSGALSDCAGCLP